MRSARRGTSESLVLAAGLLSAALLAWAAFRVVEDPRASGHAALGRLAGDTADGIVAEWNRLLREDAAPVPPLGDTFAWAPGRTAPRVDLPPVSTEHGVSAAPGVSAARGVSAEDGALTAQSTEAAPPSSAAAFDALLGEARRLEMIQADPEQALAAVLDALPAAPDAARRAAARLRIIQLAGRLQRAELAGQQWALVAQELSGAETLPADAPDDLAPRDTSLLLLCGLAAAPALDEDGRTDACHRLIALWCGGVLSLPGPVDTLVLDASSPDAGRALPDPRREALRRRLAAADSTRGDASASLWEADAERRQLAALERALGSLPGTVAERAAADAAGWQIDTRAALPFLWRALADGRCEGRFTTWPALRTRLADALARHALLPDGFLVAWDASPGETPAATADAPAGAALVRERTPLVGDAFGFALRHRDPDAFVGEELRRAAWLRGGLLLLAALIAGTAALTARTLRRERALAGLRSAFIAGVSHELRTPVSSILLMADNLQAGRVGGEAALARYHGLIRREALRLRRLVDDVLDMSRLERGEGVRLAVADISLPEFVADLAAEARELVERAGGRFTLVTPPDALPPAAALDAEAVRRAVLNLVDNALRHSGSMDVSFGARLQADPRAASEASGTLILCVADAGRGVAARDRERVFQPFERVGGATPVSVPSSAAPGVGLGLAIVRAIALAHGGTARVVEPGGPGAVFEIRLPLQGAEIDAAPARRRR